VIRLVDSQAFRVSFAACLRHRRLVCSRRQFRLRTFSSISLLFSQLRLGSGGGGGGGGGAGGGGEGGAGGGGGGGAGGGGGGGGGDLPSTGGLGAVEPHRDWRFTDCVIGTKLFDTSPSSWA